MRPIRALRTLALVPLLLAARADAGPGGTLPSSTFAPDQLYRTISPPMGSVKHNQPSIVNGYLMLAGNAKHELWDIHNPTVPKLVSLFEGPHHEREAESHQVSFARRVDRHYSVTISGKGIDFWDLTDGEAPALLSSMLLEGIDYGDNTNAVWGVSWQGRFVWVGGTNTGLHVVDASDPASPALVMRVPTSEMGGVSTGPLFALGNLLVVTTPKEHAGVATLDISDPGKPALLDFQLPSEESYIGGFYGRHLYLLTPFRAFDVTADPAKIALVGTHPSPKSEYMSFADDRMFVGALRPDPGIFKFDLSDPTKPVEMAKIEGRRDKLDGAFTDDQFSLPVGNLLVISDDEVKIGSILAVHDTERDSKPPSVLYVNPPDGSTGQAKTSRVGLSFSDQIDLRSVDASSVLVRPVGGAPLAGWYGHTQTLVNFWPDEPLLANTTYEVVVPAGGVRDLAGNPIAQGFAAVFSTGDQVAAPPCKIETTVHTPVGTPATLRAEGAPPGAAFGWTFGDGEAGGSSVDPSVSHVYAAPGRYPVTLTVTADGVSRSCTGLQVAHRPLGEAPSRSSTVALHPGTARAWVVNPDADTVALVDTDTLHVVAETAVGDHPRTVAVAPDGTAWVACQDSDEIIVLSKDAERLGDVRLPWGSAPFGIAFSPETGRGWVTLEGKGAVGELDAGKRELVRTIDLGARSVRALALSGDRMLVARFLSPADRGELFELSQATATLVRTLELAADPGPDESTRGRGIPNALGALAISPDGVRAFVPAKKDNTLRGLSRDGEKLTTDNTVRTIVSFVDLGTGSEDAALRADLDNHDMASAVVASPVGDLVFVATQGTNHLEVLDAYSGKLVAGFTSGLAPQGVALSAEGKLLVQSFMSRTLEVYDVSGILAGTDGAAVRLGAVTTVTSEPLSPRVLLGKQIFYNAADPRMSLDGYLSCATCHPDGREDARVWDFTDRGEGLRNTTTLEGRAGTGHGPVHWTGNFDEIQDFENDIRLHFGGGGFLSEAQFSEEGRADPLGRPKSSLSEPLDALAEFVATLDRFPRSPHRNGDGSLTDGAKAGREVFRASGCLECHSGQKLTDSAKGVLHDVGTLRPSSGKRLGQALSGIDTPTLRGLWATAPYLHDGSAASLHGVLENPQHGSASSLSTGDRDLLVEFLLQVENEELDLTPPAPKAAPLQGEGSGEDGCGCRAGSSAPTGGSVGMLSLLILLRLRSRARLASRSR
jgi:YVTN family beta-propeller protein